MLVIISECILLSKGTHVAFVGVCMLYVITLSAPNIYAGMYDIIGVLIGGSISFLLLKYFKKRNMWSKLPLKDRLTKEAGYSTINTTYETLVGKEGMTLTDLRPVGIIRVNDQDYSAVSNAEWIPKQSKIKIIAVDGTKILVEKIGQ